MYGINPVHDAAMYEETMERDKAYLYSRPEEGFEEYSTSEYICNRLKEIGYSNISRMAETGVVAELICDPDVGAYLFRAEMDAVRTKSGDLRHVCGHDSHMAMMLSFAQWLFDNRELLKSNVKIIFQPAEESCGGAKVMIREGVLDLPPVKKVFALHVWSDIECGRIVAVKGPFMASGDEFEITVRGRSCHAATPELGIDALSISAEIVNEINEFKKHIRRLNNRSVITIATINGGSAKNILCDCVKMTGTARSFDNSLRPIIKEGMKKIVEGIAEKYGGIGELNYIFRYPALVNTPDVIDELKDILYDSFGKENVTEDYYTMCAEDFANFLTVRDGAMFLVGCSRNENEKTPLHSNNFTPCKGTMLYGLELFMSIADKYLFQEEINH